MIKNLKLTNFRKHTDSEYSFSQGLQVLRGSNEVGKTTILEGILYALLGTTALRTSLADTVTYGQPESSLKVALEFCFDDVDYFVTRSKSGAEINYSGGSVVGQKETRLFVETLLGCTAEVASAILFADQNSVRGILTAGPSAAGSLVEKLAGLEQLETLIAKAQESLPCGSMTTLAGQLTFAELQAAVEPFKPSDAPVVAAEAATTAAKQVVARSRAALDVLEPKLRQAEAANTLLKSALEANSATQARRQKLLQVHKPAQAPCTLAELERLEASERDKVELGFRYAAYKTVFPASQEVWDAGLESFTAARDEVKLNLTKQGLLIQSLKDQILTTKMLRVNETSCSFCKKDLTNVQEVVDKNTVVDAKVLTLASELQAAKDKEQELLSLQTRLQNISSVSAATERLANSRYWKLTDDVPVKPVWIGEVPQAPGEKVDTAKLRKEFVQYTDSLAAWTTAQEKLAELILIPVPDDVSSEVFEQREAARKDLETATSEEASSLRKLAAAQSSYAAASATYRAEIKAKDVAQVRVLQIKATLVEMAENNELIKKLRNLRPKIAAKLWATVLHAVSHYFSEIRGTSCCVTRDDAGFKVDGKGVAGLSGSTLDSLGLAIRLALSRMFLPNVGFMFLDEPASGCDDNREIAMLGVVASSGFPQILLVTHSDVGDSLAQNLVQV